MADLSSSVFLVTSDEADVIYRPGQQQQQQAGSQESASGPSAEEHGGALADNAGRRGDGDDEANSSSSSRDGKETRSVSNLETHQYRVDEHEPAEETATYQVGQSGSRKRKQEEIVESVEERKKKIVRMCTSDEPWTLPTLPVELQKRILCFVGAHYWGATQDLLHCEPKCRGLYQAIHDDDNGVFWKYCIGVNLTYHHFPAMSHRERACVYDAIRQIRKEQKKTDNILESCMGIRTAVDCID
jgi:hypothetical protein